MKELILLLVTSPIILVGYYIWTKVDKLVWQNKKAGNKELELKAPTAVRMTGGMSIIEINREIEKFRQDHENFVIILTNEDEEDKANK